MNIHYKSLRLWSYVLVIIALPTSEALKNLLLFLSLVLWLLTTTWEEKTRKKISSVELVFLLVITTSLLSSLPAYLGADNTAVIHGLSDTIRIFIFSWILYRENLSEKDVSILSVSVFFSLAISIGYSFFFGKYNPIELHSVGHINHTAIYLAIVFGLAWSWLLAIYASQLRNRRLLFAAILAVLPIIAYLLQQTSARGALLPLMLFVFFSPVLLLRTHRATAYVFLVLILTGTFLLSGKPLWNEFESILSFDIGSRDSTLKTSFIIFLESPWIGIGPNNFSAYDDIKTLTRISTEHGLALGQLYTDGGHGHSLYGTWLAERGVIGMITIFVLGWVWAHLLYTSRPSARPTYLTDMALWGGSASAWTLIFIGGLFNTTFHHENAILAMALFSMWMSLPRTKNSGAAKLYI
jgi:O-antigen ligase